MSKLPNSLRWLTNENAATTSAETKNPATKPPENPVRSLPNCFCIWRKSTSRLVETVCAALVSNRLKYNGDLRDAIKEGPDITFSMPRAGWRIQSRICSRASADRFVNLNPPIVCVSSVHASLLPVSMNRETPLVCAPSFPASASSASIRWPQ